MICNITELEITLPTRRLLSKTTYLHGLRCPKLLWHAWNTKHLVQATDEQSLAALEEGKQVGRLAWQLYPGGIEVIADHFEEAVALTEVALLQRRPLFEAAVAYQDLCIRCDIVNPVAEDLWDLIEVKSTTSIQDDHIEDLAFQKHVLDSAGIKVRSCILAHINREFVKKGQIDPRRFFTLEDLTDQVAKVKHRIAGRVAEMVQVAHLPKSPRVEIGPRCNTPRECPLRIRCWSHLSPGNSTELYRGGGKRFQLLTRGVKSIADIPDNFKLTENQQIQRRVAKTGKPHINAPAIRDFLSRIMYPASFLDFETWSTAIPIHDGVRPYQQVPFQYSLHVVDALESEPRHYQFLAEGTDDPRPAFMRSLRDSLPSNGSVVVFNSSFEIGRLYECAEQMPEFGPWVQDIEGRVIDLLMPFRQFAFYAPQQRGSCSMKRVLPALTTKSYEDFEIQDGKTASLKFLRTAFGKLCDQERIKIRQELIRYCHLDTLGMLLIIRALRRLVEVELNERIEA